MKLIKIIPIILVFLIALTSVSAERYVNYQFKEATIASNGELTYTNAPVTDVSAVGFVCADGECASVSGTLWNSNVLNSGTSDNMQLTYPTARNANGYGVYYYKPGYITWEARPTWYGTTSNDPQGPYQIYLSKKDTCTAPVDTFTILNDVQPNVPLVIEIEASLDATTYASLHNAGPLKYTPTSLADEYYSVQTRVTLEITKANSQVETQTRIINIPFSGSKRMEFTWIPEEEGDYRAKVITFVIDDKCSSSENQEAASWFTVLEEDPKEMCYTLLNGLAVSNQFPNAGETITITANKISNYANDNYELTSIPTKVDLTITRKEGNVIVHSETRYLGANANSQDTEGLNFDWTIPSETGWYDIEVNAIANDGVCSSIENLDETERIGVYVDERANGAPILSGIPDQYINENQVPPTNWIDLWAYSSDSQTSNPDLQFSIVSQSNTELIYCRLANDEFVNCNNPTYNTYGYSDVTIEVSDGSFWDRDTFRINVNRVNNYPIISNIPNVRFEINGEASLDLDHYTQDPDNTNNELTWSYTGNDNVNVEFDPITRVVKFSGKRHWFGEERITFTVTDPNGLSDSDVSVVYIDVPKPENDDIIVARIANNDYINSGDLLRLNIELESNTYEDLENLRMTAVIQELGIKSNTELFDLEGREERADEVSMQIPGWAAPGYYEVRLTISNDNLRRVIHREIKVI